MSEMVHGSIARKLELPGELWARILRHHEAQFGPSQSKARVADLKALSLVSHLFGGICQKMLFDETSVNICIQMDYKNPDADFGPLPDSDSDSGGASPGSETDDSEEGPAFEEWNWEKWERDMRNAVRAERRLALIGTDPFLSIKPRKMTVEGLNTYPSFPANPFQRPLEEQPLSRAIFDAFHRFGQTLCDQLSAFVNIRQLELSRYPVDNGLLKAIDAHPRLSELRFDFCWFPKSTTPLTSITSLTFGQIPGSHINPPVLILYPGDEPHEDHYVASAFDLISPDHLEHLDVSFGSHHSYAEPVFKQLRTRTSLKGEFRRLNSLVWHFDSSEVPSSLIIQFLAQTPTLRELDVRGSTPLLPESLFPPRFLPLLETLSCPFDWARSLVPGRPIKNLKLLVHSTQERAKFLASTEMELDNLLLPLAMSTALTTLHFPPYPPVAPISLLMPYLAAHFPFVRDLKVAVAEERVTLHHSFVCMMRAGSGMPMTDTEEQFVEGGLLEVLEREVREDVNKDLASGPERLDPTSRLSPIQDRVKAFRRGISLEAAHMEADQAPPEHSPSPRLAKVPNSYLTPPNRAIENEVPVVSPLAVLDQYFRRPGGEDFAPGPTPESVVDALYFLARGAYTLPQSIESLYLYSCFERLSPLHYSCSWITPEMDWKEGYVAAADNRRRYTQAVLDELSRVYPALMEVGHVDLVLNGHGGAYRRAAGQWISER